LGISDRILVMREGVITGEVTNVAGATQESVMALAT
jgi:ABC-type sugar transport system ATPase subunit